MSNIYAKFNLNSLEEEKKLIEDLKSLGYDFETSFYSTGFFWKEEAEFRLDMYEDSNEVEVDEEVRAKVLEDIEEELFNDDYVIDCERIEDVVIDVLRGWQDNIKDVSETEDEYADIRGTIFVDESALM